MRKKSLSPLVIRADAGGLLGIGHVMRMIALMQAYQSLGGEVILASASCPAPLAQRLKKSGILYHVLTTKDYGSREDALETIELASAEKAGWIVLDGYHFDEVYQSLLRESEFRVLCVDDYGHCETWNCHALLNQNLGADSWGPRKSEVPGFTTFLGTDFTLLRREFWEGIPRREVKLSPIKNVLMTLGGVDLNDATGAVLHQFENLPGDPLSIRVLVGAGNPNREGLEARKSRHDLEIIVDATDMPDQFAWADGVVCAGGSTCWEILRYGLPSAVVTIADNQVPVVRALCEDRLAVDLGWEQNLSVDTEVAEKLSRWLKEPEEFIDIAKLQTVIDGKGAHRVASFLANGLVLREAAKGDCELYFQWVNEAAVRQNALDQEPIKRENHEEWFPSRLASDKALLYVAQVGTEAVGQIRFEEKSIGQYVLSYSIDQHHRGKGLAKPLLLAGVDRLTRVLRKSFEIIAEVRLENSASIRALQKAGFIQHSESNGILMMSYHHCL